MGQNSQFGENAEIRMPLEASAEIRAVAGQNERIRILGKLLRENDRAAADQLVRKLAADAEVGVFVLTHAKPQEAACGEFAIAVQIQAGKQAFIWPPRRIDDGSTGDRTSGESAMNGQGKTAHETPKVSLPLFAKVEEWLQQHEVALAQSLLPTSDLDGQTSFREAGYDHLTNLAYLVAGEETFPETTPRTDLTFVPLTEETLNQNMRALAELVERTYVRSRDCPAINGKRDANDVLAGYRGVGRFCPANWFVVKKGDHDVGCLILAEHGRDESAEYDRPANTGKAPRGDHATARDRLLLELVYMGVTPEVRGAGIGVEIVRFAQQRAKELGIPRLMLAVDANNQPAISVYVQCGFALLEQRSVLLRNLADDADDILKGQDSQDQAAILSGGQGSPNAPRFLE